MFLLITPFAFTLFHLAAGAMPILLYLVQLFLGPAQKGVMTVADLKWHRLPSFPRKPRDQEANRSKHGKCYEQEATATTHRHM